MKESHIVVFVVTVLICTYLAMFYVAKDGYGYMGYYGYHRGSSFWYWGGPDIYYEPSNRSGSAHGTSRLGGGPGSGK